LNEQSGRRLLTSLAAIQSEEKIELTKKLISSSFHMGYVASGISTTLKQHNTERLAEERTRHYWDQWERCPWVCQGTYATITV
jgi:hypothetical protein